jgi:transposase
VGLENFRNGPLLIEPNCRYTGPSAADGVVTISSTQLSYLLSGIDWRHPQETWRLTSVG